MRLLLRRSPLIALGTIAFILVIYSIGLGRVHLFDWDEINFAECAREMRLSGEYLYAQIGFLPFWEKPPLFFWLQAASMSLWGETEWATRFPNVLILGITLGMLYRLGRRWHGPFFGWLWMFFYGTALLPAFYARSGLIDPLFNLFMLLAAMSGSQAFTPPASPWKAGAWTGLWMALAVLTKGPVGIGLPALSLLTLSLAHRQLKTLLPLGIIAALITSLIIGSWLSLLYLSGKAYLLSEFWAYQWRLFSTADAGHAGPWYYHIVVWLVGLLPASPWALIALRRLRLSTLPIPAQTLLGLTLWTLLIFSIVQTKIIHYSSLGYFGVTYLAALGWQKARKTSLPWLLSGAGIGLLVAFSALLPLFMKQVGLWLEWVRDPFAQEVLRSQPVAWSGWEGWPALLILAGLGLLFIVQLGSVARIAGLGLLTMGWESFVLWVYAPKAEAYSQGPLIRFCQQAAAEGAIVWPLGFKSYAPYFYGRMMPSRSPGQWGNVAAFQAALLRNEVGPTYFVSRVDRYRELVENLNLQVVERSGGYVLLSPRAMPHQVSR
jgi:4-amino-4-deoxy-L-arabinose transferase-like glycosyltransferase